MKHLLSTQNILIGTLAILLVLFLAVMFWDNLTWAFRLFGVCDKYEILKFLGIGMGGILIALQALASHRRAKAMEDAANAQAKANLHTEKGQRQERLKNAIEHLGHTPDSVRLGGAYELFHLAEDTPELRQTVLEILCAHIRGTTGENEYRETYKLTPSEEIQSLLTLLFVREDGVFNGLHINLRGSWLNGASLQKARLRYADLRQANLQETILTEADLRGVDCQEARLSTARLDKAWMQEAELGEAHLERSILWETQLQGANLTNARLQGAGLEKARLHGASLWGAYLQGAVLEKARLQGAQFGPAQLQGADLRQAQLQGARLWQTQLQGTRLWQVKLEGVSSDFDIANLSQSFQDRIRQRCGKETDLSSATFTGGLCKCPHPEDPDANMMRNKWKPPIDFVVEGLSDEHAKCLRDELKPHIDKPASHELPANNTAITGTYSEEEAEKWIAEYEEAMSDLRGNDS